MKRMMFAALLMFTSPALWANEEIPDAELKQLMMENMRQQMGEMCHTDEMKSCLEMDPSQCESMMLEYLDTCLFPNLDDVMVGKEGVKEAQEACMANIASAYNVSLEKLNSCSSN